jgi:hypothetical protein
MYNDSNLMQQIVLSKNGVKAQSKSKFEGHKHLKTHTCSASDITHQIQETDVYRNTYGDYIISARDMGWNHPFWTKMRANILADAVSRLPYTWEKIEIPFYLEERLTSSLTEVEVKYIVIRNYIETGLKSTVFVAGGTKAEIDIGPAIESTLVFDPHIRAVERFGFSPNIEFELKLARTEALVEMALNSIPHILCEGIPDDTDFPHRLNFYLQADNMLINGDSPMEKTILVDKTGLLNRYGMVYLENLMTNPSVNLSGWEMEFSYRGLPESEVNELKVDPAYTFDEHRLWAKATLIGETIFWYLESGIPKEKEDKECPKLTWLINQKKNMSC